MNITEKDLQEALKQLTGCDTDTMSAYGEAQDILISPEDKNKIATGMKEGVLRTIDPNKSDGYTHEIYFKDTNTSIWAKLTNDMGMNWSPAGYWGDDGKFYVNEEIIVTISPIKDTLQWKVVGVQEDQRITPGATTMDRGDSSIIAHEDYISIENTANSSEDNDDSGSGSSISTADGENTATAEDKANDDDYVGVLVENNGVRMKACQNQFNLTCSTSMWDDLFPNRILFAQRGINLKREDSYIDILPLSIELNHINADIVLDNSHTSVIYGPASTVWNAGQIKSTIINTNFQLADCLIKSQTGRASETLTCEYIEHLISDEQIIMDIRTDEAETETPNQIFIKKNASKAQFDDNLIKIWKEDMPYGEAYITIDKTPSEEGVEGEDRVDNIIVEYGGIVRVNPEEIWAHLLRSNISMTNDYLKVTFDDEWEEPEDEEDPQMDITSGLLMDEDKIVLKKNGHLVKIEDDTVTIEMADGTKITVSENSILQEASGHTLKTDSTGIWADDCQLDTLCDCPEQN